MQLPFLSLDRLIGACYKKQSRSKTERLLILKDFKKTSNASLVKSEKCELANVSDHFENEEDDAVGGILEIDSFYAKSLGIKSTTLAE